MTEQRHLAAILVADMVGYSKTMGRRRKDALLRNEKAAALAAELDAAGLVRVGGGPQRVAHRGGAPAGEGR